MPLLESSSRPLRPAADIACGALVGVAAFFWAVPWMIIVPTNLQWMLEADRAAQLMGWLFFRSEPWRFPLGTIHTLLVPGVTTVGYSDSIPWLAALSKLVWGWVPVPFQYSGLWLLACFVLQGVFGVLLLRALHAPRVAAVAGAAFFVTSPVLLERYQHITLSAHWMLLVSLWLYVRTGRAEGPVHRVRPWLLVAVIAASSYPYLAVMVLALAAASFLRDAVVDRHRGATTALGHFALVVSAVVVTFWVWGYFSFTSGRESGFGVFSADALAFLNPAHTSSFLPPIGGIADSYEGYGYLGLGVIVLAIVGLASGNRSADELPLPRWPLAVVVTLLFVYALATPIHVAGHPVSTVPLYAHLGSLPATFRVSARFIWPAYYLCLAATLAIAARAVPAPAAPVLLGAALVVQLLDIAPLRTEVRVSYTRQHAELHDSAWMGIGRFFNTIRLVPPIIAHRVACAKYDRPDDYSIRFSLLAVQERLRFNSGNLGRVDDLRPLCAPMLDSLRRGLIDDRTVYVPDSAYRDSVQRWAGHRIVCGTLDEANVCVARDANAPLTRRLLAQQAGSAR